MTLVRYPIFLNQNIKLSVVIFIQFNKNIPDKSRESLSQMRKRCFEVTCRNTLMRNQLP